MKKSDFMLQVILELVKRDGALDGEITHMVCFTSKLCDEILTYQPYFNKPIFDEGEGIEINYPDIPGDDISKVIENYKRNGLFPFVTSVDEKEQILSFLKSMPQDMTVGEAFDNLFSPKTQETDEEFITGASPVHLDSYHIRGFNRDAKESLSTDYLMAENETFQKPEWKPENVKEGDYVGFHYEGYRDQEGQVKFISKKIVPELSITTKDGKSWKVSRDNIFDPAKLLEK